MFNAIAEIDIYSHPVNLDAEAARVAREGNLPSTGGWTALRRATIVNLFRQQALGLAPVQEDDADQWLADRARTRDELYRPCF